MRKIPEDKILQHIIDRCDRSGGADACWEWQGVRTPQGYGFMRFRGRTSTVSRIVCLLVNNLTAEQLPCTRHACDNPPCCNPKHILAGTHKQNSADVIEHGRRAKEHKPHTRIKKLTDDQVRAIRQDWRPLNLVAWDHGISESVVSMVRRRKAKQLVPD